MAVLLIRRAMQKTTGKQMNNLLRLAIEELDLTAEEDGHTP
jgi:hypothetical protein